MNVLKFALVAAAFSLTAGCDTLSEFMGGSELGLLQKAAEVGGKVEDATLGNGAKALPKYCSVPRSARNALRARLNARPEAQNNKLGIWCEGDPVLTLGP